MNDLTPYAYYRWLVIQGYGYEKAYELTWGPIEEDTLEECAKKWHKKGRSLSEISFWCTLVHGRGCKSVVYRILNKSAYQKHLLQKRKKK